MKKNCPAAVFFFAYQTLHLLILHAAVHTALAHAEHHQGGQADQDVDEAFEPHPVTQNKMNDVPVGVDPDQAPVESADNQQNPRDLMHATHFSHHTMRVRLLAERKE